MSLSAPLHPPLALVTGGVARVGAAIAARLARAGYALALHYHTSAELDPVLADVLAEEGTDFALFPAELADADAPDALIAAVMARFGRAPDLLVNSASRFAEGTWEDADADALSEMFAVNTLAPVLLSRAVVRAAAEGQQPAIVHILDQRVAQPVPDQFAYGLSKGALHAATRAMAVAFGGGARVNAVAPGLVLETEDFSPEQLSRLSARMPLGRLPTPADVAEAVLSLARAEATTGQTLFVDGGAHLAAQGRDFVYLERD